MGSSKVTASYQVIDLVREAISTPYVRASDAAVARALGVTPGTVGGFKAGRESMSLSLLSKAQEFMKLTGPQLAELSVAISMEGAKDPGALAVWQAIRDSVRGPMPGILLAAFVGLGAMHPAPAAASTVPAPGFGGDNVYYGKSRRQRRQWLARVLGSLNPPPLLSAQYCPA